MDLFVGIDYGSKDIRPPASAQVTASGRDERFDVELIRRYGHADAAATSGSAGMAAGAWGAGDEHAASARTRTTGTQRILEG